MPSAVSQAADSIHTIVAQRQITTCFQAIFDTRQHCVLGHEALSRGPNGPYHRADKLFSAAAESGVDREMERVCAELACERFCVDDGLLFLNFQCHVLLEPGFADWITTLCTALPALNCHNIVIELTELACPVDQLTPVIQSLRDAGIRLALDDLGAAHSSLLRWLELRPDYVKLDRELCRDVHNNPGKQAMLTGLIGIATEMNSTLIAEGIETVYEALCLQQLGIRYMQGYLFHHPGVQWQNDHADRLHHQSSPSDNSGESPTPVNRGSRSKDADPMDEIPSNLQSQQSIAALITPCPAVSMHSPLRDVIRHFKQSPDIHSITLLDGQNAVGSISRSKALELYSSDFGRELYGRKTVSVFMDEDIPIVEQSMGIEDVSYLLTENHSSHIVQECIVVNNGRYIGVVRTTDLLRCITDRKIRNARYANPLTLLPGNVPISEHISQLLEQGCDFAVAYCDINHFKAFNDAYGYSAGDSAIKMLAKLLQQHAPTPENFIGHVGGDDFIVIFRNTDCVDACSAICCGFAENAKDLYALDDQQHGGIWSKDRSGRPVFYRTMTLSIGLCYSDREQMRNADDVSRIASDAKKQAKRLRGGGVHIAAGGDREKQMNYSAC